jgi:hypothetical protein
MSWELEAGGTNDVACECCGNLSRTINGFLHEDGVTRAAYLVHWTRGHVTRDGANIRFHHRQVGLRRGGLRDVQPRLARGRAHQRDHGDLISVVYGASRRAPRVANPGFH